MGSPYPSPPVSARNRSSSSSIISAYNNKYGTTSVGGSNSTTGCTVDISSAVVNSSSSGGGGVTVKLALVTRIEVKNSFAIYDESAMDDTAGDPPRPILYINPDYNYVLISFVSSFRYTPFSTNLVHSYIPHSIPIHTDDPP